MRFTMYLGVFLTLLFVTQATASGGDFDGDGLLDDEDACSFSDLSETIVIVGCNTKVGNMLFEDGCTMSDLITQCAVGAMNHGEFVSCVADLTNGWVDDGLITHQQRAAIQSCAAQAGFPNCNLFDLNADGTVGIADFLLLLALWGTHPGGPPDFDGDGSVGITDFLALLANWGPCP